MLLFKKCDSVTTELQATDSTVKSKSKSGVQSIHCQGIGLDTRSCSFQGIAGGGEVADPLVAGLFLIPRGDGLKKRLRAESGRHGDTTM